MYGPCMATKTITIDLTAYEALRRRKRLGQSFSDVIKEHFGKRFTGRDLEALLDSLEVDPDTLARIDEVVEERRKDPARVPEL